MELYIYRLINTITWLMIQKAYLSPQFDVKDDLLKENICLDFNGTNLVLFKRRSNSCDTGTIK